VTVTRTAVASVPSATSSYCSVRSLTELLAAPLSAEDQTVQSMPDVSPTKWHRAHTTWFFETFLLGPHAPGYRAFHEGFGYLFNSYYEAVGDRYPRSNRGCISRPGAEEIGAYRRYVDEAMETLVSGDLSEKVASLVELGLHHEQQHQELILMDIKHVLAQNPLAPAYRPAGPRAPEAGAAISWTSHDSRTVAIGHGETSFAFDNETPRHECYVAAYDLADRPVNCGEFLAFIEDGGYSRPELWLSDGWAHVMAHGIDAPMYWARVDDSWSVFTLGGRRALTPAEPVCHVSYYEADAYARWSGARLPTEAEWEAALPARDVGADFDPDDVHPRPPTGPGGAGLVWEWTASAYLPYPGFRALPGAVGEYNGKFMVNQHVLRGGSVATPPGHVRPTYRNFFPTAARWPFTGLRLARDRDHAS
jgi:ergothioneine biosynthesis protein EgtB